ncbi:MAG: alanyl-tRNA editing protein [Candidatus Methanofastidiosia archaeon]|jgi:alanyl-tRNA synthetase
MWKYYQNSYLKEFDTTVVDVDNTTIKLEDTIFYPTGGGQPHDRGTINTHTVKDVFEKNGTIFHVVENLENVVTSGDAVHCILDWKYRYTIMRMHSALHLLYCVAEDVLGISASAGSNVDAKKSRVDLVYDTTIDQETREKLTKEFSRVVDCERPIEIWWDGKKRFVKIEGYPALPCGGLHTKTTKEIGYLKKLKRKNVGKGKERLEVFL